MHSPTHPQETECANKSAGIAANATAATAAQDISTFELENRFTTTIATAALSIGTP
jgi:hypothetical protein